MTATYTYYTTDVKGNIRESEEVITQVLKWNNIVLVAFVFSSCCSCLISNILFLFIFLIFLLIVNHA